MVEDSQVEHQKAVLWNNPLTIIQIEENRGLVERALGRIVANVFTDYVPIGSKIFEIGAGLGYLKTLVPSDYHAFYLSSDYNRGNLATGLTKRPGLRALLASAYHLPLPDDSIDCLMDMDAYDTFPNLGKALKEVKRALKPGGRFIHFQIGYPSDDTVWSDYPNYVFFPTSADNRAILGMVGMKKTDLERDVRQIEIPALREELEEYIHNPEQAYARAVRDPQSELVINMIHQLLDYITAEKLVIPSVPVYFKQKLERLALEADLSVLESEFRLATLRVSRNNSQQEDPSSRYNQFNIDQGIHTHTALIGFCFQKLLVR